MTAYPKVDPGALAKAVKAGVSFASTPSLMTQGIKGQYDPATRVVGLTPWADDPVFAHEFGSHAMQHVNPLRTLGRMPFETAIQQIPYSGLGFALTPGLLNLVGRPLAEDPRENLAYTAQGTPYGGIDTQQFYGWMYRGGKAPFGASPTTYNVQGIQRQPKSSWNIGR